MPVTILTCHRHLGIAGVLLLATTSTVNDDINGGLYAEERKFTPLDKRERVAKIIFDRPAKKMP
jgi:hypothetical protein